MQKGIRKKQKEENKRKKTTVHANVKVAKPGNSKDIFEYYFICFQIRTCTHTYSKSNLHKKQLTYTQTHTQTHFTHYEI